MTTRRERMTQAQRSATTRAALLDSAIECLAELGYDRATTGEICERAGLSRGAHLHHFQTRAALFAAAGQALADRVGGEFERLTRDLPDGPDRPAALLDQAWALYTGPLFTAILELAVHARTDAELRAQLAPVERRASDTAFQGLRVVAVSDEAAVMALATIRGLAILPVLEPGYDPARRWPYARAQLLELLNGR